MTVDWESTAGERTGNAHTDYLLMRRGVSDILAQFLDSVPGLQDVLEECPDPDVCRQNVPRTIAMSVMHLNDSHQWTREQIAEWLDMLHRMGHDLSLHTGEEEDR